ncbi:MAG: hypothetical protein EOO39_32805 [Cytophagaceae bacterium]|nr:MAG: hypothetical protein EOO39_32805 [Cytophagaceae bacterium]
MPKLLIDTLPVVRWNQWPALLIPPDIAVFRYRLCGADQPWLHSLLQPSEQKRATRFRQLADKQRFVAGRGWLRFLVGQLTGQPATHIQLTAGSSGKPELVHATSSQGSWHINVSHSGDWVLLAVGYVPVGVDVEWIKPDWPFEDMIESSFNADDRAQLVASQNPRELFTPLWNKSDMLVHGLRRLEVTSSYGFNYRERGSIGESVYRQRRNALLRDWYCLNPQYLSGTLSLATGAPHVRIGGRLYVPAAIPSQNLNFYIEGVSHSWQQPMGTRTQITVTRGYQGTDDAHLADLRAEAAKYTRDGYLGY